MADSKILKKEVTFSFANESTRKVTVNNFNPDTEGTTTAVSEFKAKVKAFNNSDVTLAATAYFSNPDDDGNVYPVTGIKDAAVVTTEKTVIFAKTESARLAALNVAGGDE